MIYTFELYTCSLAYTIQTSPITTDYIEISTVVCIEALTDLSIIAHRFMILSQKQLP